MLHIAGSWGFHAFSLHLFLVVLCFYKADVLHLQCKKVGGHEHPHGCQEQLHGRELVRVTLEWTA